MVEYYEIIEIKPGLSTIRILYYEVEMLNKPVTKTNDQLENNIRVESFLLHARNLIEFLNGSGHVKCSEFKDSNGKKISPVEVVPHNVIETINEHLSHISNKRKKRWIKWELLLLRMRINKEISEFLDKISSDYFSREEIITRDLFNKVINADHTYSV